MSALGDWLRDKPINIAMLGELLVTTKFANFTMFSAIQEERAGVPIPKVQSNLQAHLGLYTDHWRVLEAMQNALHEIEPSVWPDGPTFRAIVRKKIILVANSDTKSPDGTRQQNVSGVDRSVVEKGAWEFHRRAVAALIKNRNNDYSHLAKTSEASFVFRILVRCWMKYGKSPWHLFWKVTRKPPCLASLKKLIAVDPTIIHHVRLTKILHPLDPKLAVERRLWLAKALQQPRSSSWLTPQQLIRLPLVLLSKISEAVWKRLAEPALRALYDARARDEGKLRDDSLPPGNEALQKGIQRDRQQWPVDF